MTILAQMGEHIASVTCHSSIIYEFFNKNFFPHEMDCTHVDIKIDIHNEYGVPFTDYEVTINKNQDSLFYRRADYLIQTTHDYKEATIYVHDELALKHALMNFYSGYILHYNWGLLIHSSCVVEDGKAHMFTGRSGAGKSTAAKLSAPRELLSDEATLVKISPEGITVYNSPFRSEIESTGQETPTPLKSIQLLRQASYNRRKQIKKSDALFDLMDKVFYWVHSPEETKKIMMLLKNLVEKVPVYEMHFEKNETFWELIL